MGGQKVFIKSVLQSLPVYAMQYFLFPKSVCAKLEGIMKKFWWANRKTLKGIHWSTRSTLCLPKTLGGVGFRELSKFNTG